MARAGEQKFFLFVYLSDETIFPEFLT